MAVSTTNNRVQYTQQPGGTVTQWDFDFSVDHAEELQVYLNEESTPLVLNTDYTVALNADQQASPGGTVTISPAVVAETLITIIRILPLTQEIDLINGGAYNAEVVENGLDRLTKMCQQLDEENNRALKMPVTYGGSGADLIQEILDETSASEAAAAASASAAALSESEAASSAAEALLNAEKVAVLRHVEVVAGSAKSVFTMPFSYDSANKAIRVSVDRVDQLEEQSEFTCTDDTTVTLSEAQPVGTLVVFESIVTSAATDILPTIVTYATSTAENEIRQELHSVTAYGATGDGVTDDTAAILAAAAANEQIYFPKGDYLVSGTPTLDVLCVFDAAAKIIVPAGVTLTANDVQAARTQCFDCQGTGKVLLGNKRDVYPEWFGAKADGATDDLAAILLAIGSIGTGYLGGTVSFAPASYLVSGTVSVTSHRVRLIGANVGGTQIHCNSASAAILSFVGTSNTDKLYNAVLRDIYVSRTVAPSEFARGVEMINLHLPEVRRVQSHGSSVGFFMTACGNPQMHLCTATIDSPQYDFFGFLIYGGASGVADRNASATFDRCMVQALGTFTVTCIGFKMYGSYTADALFKWCGTVRMSYGAYVDGTASAATDYNWDIHFETCTFDENTVHGVLIDGFANDSGVRVHGCWFNALSGSGADVYVQNSKGVSVTDCELFSFANPGIGTGVHLTGCLNCITSNNQVRAKKYGIYLTGTQHCAVNGNVMTNDVGPSTAIQIALETGAHQNTVTGNSVTSSQGTGVHVAAGCVSNLINGNMLHSLIDLGTDTWKTDNVIFNP